MRLLINIPKEFEQHFQADRFEDSLHRLRADVHLMAGLYEQETAEMLIEAFKNAVPVPPHRRLIDADALYRTIDATSERTIGHTTFKETVLLDIRGMPTILESTMGQVNSEKAINEAEREE